MLYGYRHVWSSTYLSFLPKFSGMCHRNLTVRCQDWYISSDRLRCCGLWSVVCRKNHWCLLIINFKIVGIFFSAITEDLYTHPATDFLFHKSQYHVNHWLGVAGHVDYMDLLNSQRIRRLYYKHKINRTFVNICWLII